MGPEIVRANGGKLEADGFDRELFEFALLEETRLAARYPEGTTADEVLGRARELASEIEGLELVVWLDGMTRRLSRSEWPIVARRRESGGVPSSESLMTHRVHSLLRTTTDSVSFSLPGSEAGRRGPGRDAPWTGVAHRFRARVQPSRGSSRAGWTTKCRREFGSTPNP